VSCRPPFADAPAYRARHRCRRCAVRPFPSPPKKNDGPFAPPRPSAHGSRGIETPEEPATGDPKILQCLVAPPNGLAGKHRRISRGFHIGPGYHGRRDRWRRMPCTRAGINAIVFDTFARSIATAPMSPRFLHHRMICWPGLAIGAILLAGCFGGAVLNTILSASCTTLERTSLPSCPGSTERGRLRSP